MYGNTRGDHRYLNGLDCTGFIYWAMINGGVQPERYHSVKDNEYNLNSINFIEYNMYKDTIIFGNSSNEQISRIKPGDIVYVLNEKGSKEHVGMIIGSDKNNYYVAESTGARYPTDEKYTQNIWIQSYRYGLVVSKLCKSKL